MSLSKDRLKFKKNKQKELILDYLEKSNISERKFSKIFKIHRRTLRNWINERNLLPLWVFEKMKEKDNSLVHFGKFIDKILEDNWGSVKGGKNRYKQIIQKHGEEGLYSVMEHVRSKRKNSLMIDHKTPSKYSKYIIKRKINPLPLLGTLLLTDGNVYKNQISYGTVDQNLRNIFIDLCKMNNIKKIYEYKNSGFMKIYCNGRKLLPLLEKISPSFKTYPNRKETRKIYLKQTQPSIKSLSKYGKDTIIECVRLAMSSDGSISIRLRKNNGKIKLKPQLALNCTSPVLCLEWQEIFGNFDMKMNVYKSKSVWSGVRGIGTESIKNIKKFQDMGGFIDGVKISRKSKRLYDVEKNKALSFILMKREIKKEEKLNDLIKLGP